MISIYKDGSISDPIGDNIDGDAVKNVACATFNRLIRETQFVPYIRWLLGHLESNYKIPVDVEFACDGEKLYLLQCRSQAQSEEIGPVIVPSNIPVTEAVFSANRYVRTSAVEDITHVVYVVPDAYNAIPTREKRIAVAHAVGRINRTLPPKSFVMIGPGRWGSNDVRLGVPIGYSDINKCAMLIEEARMREGFTPEVSFGTHFFTDLIDDNISYLALYPDETENLFNSDFFYNSPNVLASIVPDDSNFADIIKVIHVPSATKGKKLHIMMDGEAQKALGFLR